LVLDVLVNGGSKVRLGEDKPVSVIGVGKLDEGLLGEERVKGSWVAGSNKDDVVVRTMLDYGDRPGGEIKPHELFLVRFLVVFLLSKPGCDFCLALRG
jgi:hypothetical protein